MSVLLLASGTTELNVCMRMSLSTIIVPRALGAVAAVSGAEAPSSGAIRPEARASQEVRTERGERREPGVPSIIADSSYMWNMHSSLDRHLGVSSTYMFDDMYHATGLPRDRIRACRRRLHAAQGVALAARLGWGLVAVGERERVRSAGLSSEGASEVTFPGRKCGSGVVKIR
jgi:hypothetical protein